MLLRQDTTDAQARALFAARRVFRDRGTFAQARETAHKDLLLSGYPDLPATLDLACELAEEAEE